MKSLTAALLLVILVSASATASPRSAAQPVTGFVRLLPASGMDDAGPFSPLATDTGIAQEGVSPDPNSSGEISAAIGGLATWYCGAGSPCTRGYGPDDLIAAIDPSTGIRKGERVTVHYKGYAVTVRIVDVCSCAGSRIIDLSRLAFSQLASPSKGTIPVSIEFGGPAPTLPATDTEGMP